MKKILLTAGVCLCLSALSPSISKAASTEAKVAAAADADAAYVPEGIILKNSGVWACFNDINRQAMGHGDVFNYVKRVPGELKSLLADKHFVEYLALLGGLTVGVTKNKEIGLLIANGNKKSEELAAKAVNEKGKIIAKSFSGKKDLTGGSAEARLNLAREWRIKVIEASSVLDALREAFVREFALGYSKHQKVSNGTDEAAKKAAEKSLKASKSLLEDLAERIINNSKGVETTTAALEALRQNLKGKFSKGETEPGRGSQKEYFDAVYGAKTLDNLLKMGNAPSKKRA